MWPFLWVEFLLVNKSRCQLIIKIGVSIIFFGISLLLSNPLFAQVKEIKGVVKESSGGALVQNDKGEVCVLWAKPYNLDDLLEWKNAEGIRNQAISYADYHVQVADSGKNLLSTGNSLTNIPQHVSKLFANYRIDKRFSFCTNGILFGRFRGKDRCRYLFQ